MRLLPGERELLEQVRDACVLDAVFGTGARVPAGEEGILSLSRVFAAAGALLAVDVPLGVNAEDGTVADYAVRADGTVCLSCVKCGLPQILSV